MVVDRTSCSPHTGFMSTAEREARQRVEELDAALDDLTGQAEGIRQEIEACMDEWGKAMALLEEATRG